LTMHFKNDANILPQMIFFAKAWNMCLPLGCTRGIAKVYITWPKKSWKRKEKLNKTCVNYNLPQGNWMPQWKQSFKKKIQFFFFFAFSSEKLIKKYFILFSFANLLVKSSFFKKIYNSKKLLCVVTIG
jgi:hypothetical protein